MKMVVSSLVDGIGYMADPNIGERTNPKRKMRAKEKDKTPPQHKSSASKKLGKWMLYSWCANVA
jgi:hypothetical protein